MMIPNPPIPLCEAAPEWSDLGKCFDIDQCGVPVVVNPHMLSKNALVKDGDGAAEQVGERAEQCHHQP